MSLLAGMVLGVLFVAIWLLFAAGVLTLIARSIDFPSALDRAPANRPGNVDHLRTAREDPSESSEGGSLRGPLA